MNVADEKCVKVLDFESRRELANWPLPAGLGSNFPMVLDQVRQISAQEES